MRPDPLSEAAARRHELTRSRAVQALWELDRAGTPVTFAGVAQAAGVSRCRVAPVHCCTGAPSGPCMPLVAAHGPGKPPGRFRCLARSRVPPAAVAVGCRCRVRGAFACLARRWAYRGGPASPP